MAKYISVRELRKNLANVIKDVKAHYERYVVSKHGEPEAVLMSMDDYEGWLETLEIMSDPGYGRHKTGGERIQGRQVLRL